MLMLLIEMSLWVISAFLLSLAPLLTKSYKGCKCICANGVNSSKKTSSDSDSDLDTDSTTSLGIEKSSKMNGLSWWQKKLKRKSSFSISGIHKYRYKYVNFFLQKFSGFTYYILASYFLFLVWRGYSLRFSFIPIIIYN